MAALTYFTARLYYPAIVIDTAAEVGGDVDTNPQTFGTSAGVTVTPFINNPDDAEPLERVRATNIQATTLTPNAAMPAIQPRRETQRNRR